MNNYICEIVEIFKRDLTHKNDESMQRMLQVVEVITEATLIKAITLDECEHYTYELFKLYDELLP